MTDPDDKMILRSLHLPTKLDSEFRRIAFERDVSTAELMRLFLEFGLDFMEGRDCTVNGLDDIREKLGHSLGRPGSAGS